MGGIQAGYGTLPGLPMATLHSPHRLVLTSRDEEVLRGLALCPLTAAQLLTLSQTFRQPFPSLRKVRARLRVLAARHQHVAPLVCTWQYATAGINPLNYYTLSRLGFQMVFGPEAEGSAAYVRPVAIARQRHTQALADFIVHTSVAAVRVGVAIAEASRENTVRLDVSGGSLYPDYSFTLRTTTDNTFTFFTELDNGTEPVFSTKDRDSWERKLRLYSAYALQSGTRFRVLIVSTNRPERVEHILALANALQGQGSPSLFYGIRLAAYLAVPDAITVPCFHDSAGKVVSLLPQHRQERQPLARPLATLATVGES